MLPYRSRSWYVRGMARYPKENVIPAAWLRYLMREEHITAAWLARTLGVAPALVSRWRVGPVDTTAPDGRRRSGSPLSRVTWYAILAVCRRPYDWTPPPDAVFPDD